MIIDWCILGTHIFQAALCLYLERCFGILLLDLFLEVFIRLQNQATQAKKQTKKQSQEAQNKQQATNQTHQKSTKKNIRKFTKKCCLVRTWPCWPRSSPFRATYGVSRLKGSSTAAQRPCGRQRLGQYYRSKG